MPWWQGKTSPATFLKYENTESKCRQPFTPSSKVWLSLSWSSRNSHFLYNFTLRTLWNFMENPRNCLVTDISDRWKTGRKDRHGPPHSVLFSSWRTPKTIIVWCRCWCLLCEKSGLVSRTFFLLRDCALTRLQNLQHVANLRDKFRFNPLNAELNPICHLLTFLGAHHILHVNRIRVKAICCTHDPWPQWSCVGG
jgi:hypothetical protein